MKEKELKLEIEELEERIAPSLTFGGSSHADGAGQGGTQADLDTSFGPISTGFPSQNLGGLAAWSAHAHSPVLGHGENN